MFDDLNVLEILKLGFVGIAFVLAALAYLLLKAEQKMDRPRKKMIHPIYAFMAFSLILAGLSFYLQYKSDPSSENEVVYRAMLARIDGLIDAKMHLEAQRGSASPDLTNLILELDSTMEMARTKGLLD